jgi:hypothetical protein
VDIRAEYKEKYATLPNPNKKQSDEAKEMFYALNLMRVDPIWFSNNVLEAVRDRYHPDYNYWSFAGHYIAT